MIKEGRKLVQISVVDVKSECNKWKNAQIGHVMGGTPSFKYMIKFVYSVWNYIEAQRVYLHDDGYFTFPFSNEENKSQILQNGPYTYNSRPLIMRN